MRVRLTLMRYFSGSDTSQPSRTRFPPLAKTTGLVLEYARNTMNAHAFYFFYFWFPRPLAEEMG